MWYVLYIGISTGVWCCNGVCCGATETCDPVSNTCKVKCPKPDKNGNDVYCNQNPVDGNVAGEHCSLTNDGKNSFCSRYNCTFQNSWNSHIQQPRTYILQA